MSEPDSRRYAERLSVVVRAAPQNGAAESAFSEATVAYFEVGQDGGEIPLEAVGPAVLHWQEDAEFVGWNEVDGRIRQHNFGAASVDAVVVVTLLGAVLGGAASTITQRALDAVLGGLKSASKSELRPMERAADVEQLAYAVALGTDRRRSELTLVEHRSHDTGARAVFDDRDGNRYEIRTTGDLFSITRL